VPAAVAGLLAAQQSMPSCMLRSMLQGHLQCPHCLKSCTAGLTTVVGSQQQVYEIHRKKAQAHAALQGLTASVCCSVTTPVHLGRHGRAETWRSVVAFYTSWICLMPAGVQDCVRPPSSHHCTARRPSHRPGGQLLHALQLPDSPGVLRHSGQLPRLARVW